MYNHLSIILVVIATIINSIVFGYVASNSKNNKTNKSYLIFLNFIILYTIFDCIVIQVFNNIEKKDIIVKIQALFWMPLSILFLNFIYSLLGKRRNKTFYFFSASTIISIVITLFSNKVLLGFKDYNFGTMAYTGSWFLPITLFFVLPAAIYAIYLIGKEVNIFNYYIHKSKMEETSLASMQLHILFFGSMICLTIAVTTNIFFDEVFGYNGELHLASLSLSIQSIFLLPAIIKYNFLNQPIGKLGDELYALSSDAVLITNETGTILNINQAARRLFNLSGPVNNVKIKSLFEKDYNLFSKENSFEAKTKTDYYVTIAQNTISRGNFNIGKIISIRDITDRKKSEEKLLHLTKELSNAQDVAGLGSFIFDVKNNKVTWSDKLYKIYGRNKKTFIPSRESFFNEIVHSDSRKIAIKTVDDAVKNKSENIDYVHKSIMPNGEEKWFQAIIKISYNTRGEVLIMSGTSQDVTELYSSRHLLEESELRLKMALEIAKLGRWEENHKTGEIYWSSILRKMFNVDENHKINNNIFWKMLHPEDLEWMKKNWVKAEKEKTPYTGTFRIKLKNGKIKHLNEHAEFILNSKGELYKTVGTVIDMTNIHQYQEELRHLSSHIQEVQEKERQHIAREIHDALGQRLTSITMDIDYLKNKLKQISKEEIEKRLIALTNLTEETIKLTRKISQELRPSILDNLGLISAIEWLKEEYNQRTNINFTLDMPEEDIAIKEEYATAVFRITQEALTNIIRHAEARNVDIQVKLKNSNISLKVHDDGKGINENLQPLNGKTFGVFGMQERTAMLGGEMKIDSKPNKGTTINVSIPI